MNARRLAPSLAAVLVAWVTLVAAARPHAVAPAPLPPADPLRAEFDAALAPGLADSTAARLTRFLQLHPHAPWAAQAQLELGQIDYVHGDYASAREHFRHARSGAVLEEASYWEGLSAFALGRPREARDAVNGLARARKGDPWQWEAAYLVALSFAQEGRRPEALSAYEALLNEPGGSAEAAALFQAQTLAKELKLPDEADTWAHRLAERYPDSPEAATVRADARRAQAQAQAAHDAQVPTSPEAPAHPSRPGDKGGH